MPEQKPLRIIGVGNPLMADDGLGIVAAERLAAMDWSAGVEVLDGGTGGLTLLDLFAGARAVILLDAVAMGAAPGTLRRFTAAELSELPAETPGLSLHGGGLAEVLALARELGELPLLLLFGVQPATIELQLGLSPVVTAALPELLAAVVTEVGRFELAP